ncbi:MAG: isoprenylcysteine carboxylmethyltransferase family protein [Anaerolineae bacterium]
MKLISKSALLLLILAILFMLISGSLLSWSPIVIAGQLLAVVLAVWARRSFGTAQFNIHAEPISKSLISKGPYRFIRHPMYAAALLLIWASISGHVSPLTIIMGILVTMAIIVRIITEEKLLQISYPDYTAYAGRTKRIIPFVF